VPEVRVALNTPRTLGTVTAVVLLVAATVAQTFPPPFVREGALVKLGDHSWVIPDGGTPRVPNVGIVVGSRATLVIDPGLGRRNGDLVRRELATISRNAELYVASTHYHVEHTTGIVAFPPPAKYINARAQEAEFAEGAAAQAKAFSARSALDAELLSEVVARRADITFDREHQLDLGGVRVRLLMVGPTHTRGDTVFFVDGDRVLFAGDVVMNNSFVAATEQSSLKAWLTALDVLEAWSPRTIVPAHGPVGDGSVIGVNRGLLLAIQARTRELKAQGRSVDEVAATVQKEMQAKHPTFARINGVAGAARAVYAESP
jgi:glyoxylase-like metal-dependent hydrolase (beta-lactamase superfamily II)